MKSATAANIVIPSKRYILISMERGNKNDFCIISILAEMLAFPAKAA